MIVRLVYTCRNNSQWCRSVFFFKKSLFVVSSDEGSAAGGDRVA